MSSALLRSLVHTNTGLETDNNEYQMKQVNFKTYERILKNDIKKTWATLGEKLDRQKFKPIIPFKKKALRLVTHNTYNSYTESLFKDNGLLNFCRYVFKKKIKTLTQIIS